MNNHSEVLKMILEDEGGLNEDEPAHVGGVSYAGITQTTYDGWHAPARIEKPPSVRLLADYPQIVELFYINYFARYHTWELPEFLQYIYADFVVNAGSAAVKIIQRMVEVDDDGAWGSGTSKAVAEWKALVEVELEKDPNIDNNLITDFHEQKLAHYNHLAEANPPKFGRYLPGWKKRCNKVLAKLDNYFETIEAPVKALAEDDPILLQEQQPELQNDVFTQAFPEGSEQQLHQLNEKLDKIWETIKS